MHLYIFVLLLPVIGLIVFWLLPLSAAVPVYIVILIISGLLYWIVARAMKKHPGYDLASLVGTEATVISKTGTPKNIIYVVNIRGELWNAMSRDDLVPDDTVKIISVHGLTLRVEKSGTP